MVKKTPVVGQRFSKLTITGEAPFICSNTMVFAKCDCGVEKTYPHFRLVSGKSKSCGCVRDKKLAESRSTHNLSKHPLYRVWNKIKARCYNEKSDKYQWYGGLGVIMCDEWKNDFKSFYDWAIENGWKRGLEIDKDIIPKKLNLPSIIYSPEMCSIATRKENMRSRKNTVMATFNGETKSLIDWCEIFKKKYSTVRGRVYIGWSFEKAMEFL